MKVYLIVNPSRTDAIAFALEVGKWLLGKGVDVYADPEIASSINIPAANMTEISTVSLVIAFGGDGTLIAAANLCSLSGTPILGIYFGRFGFVTQCDPTQAKDILQLFLDGNACIEDRMMIQAEIIRADQTINTIHCLNEAVIHKEAAGRLLRFSVVVDDYFLTSYPADGVLVATATGSTGYNLSAGGPVVDHSLEALILSAITPHTLSARPLLLLPTSVVTLSIEEGGDGVLSCDGQSRLHLLSGDSVRIKRSPRVTHLVCVNKADFLVKLRTKLLWSRSLI